MLQNDPMPHYVWRALFQEYHWIVEVQTEERTEKPMKIKELNLNDRIQNYVQSNQI